MLKKIHILVLFLGTVMQYHNAIADTWTDPETGYTWTYRIKNDSAEIYGTRNNGNKCPCISPSPTGAVKIPSSFAGKKLTSIGEDSFNECRAMTSVEIPDGVDTIWYDAFYYCLGLKQITLPDSITGIASYAFRYCMELQSITMGDNVEVIGSDAFYGCIKLDNLQIPDSVTTLGSRAFYYCSGITNLWIGSGLTSIGARAFDGCTGLRNVTINQYLCNNRLSDVFISAYASITNVVVLDGVTRITSNPTFLGCRNVRHISIPDSVTVIDSVQRRAFYGCGSEIFDSVSIPGLILVDGWVVDYSDSLYGDLVLQCVRGIGNKAFWECNSLTSVEISDDVSNISNDAFYNCNSITNVTIGRGVSSIGARTFAECGSLPSVTIPANVKQIGICAFEHCTNLTSVLFLGNRPENIALSKIGDNASAIYWPKRFSDLYGEVFKDKFAGYLYPTLCDWVASNDFNFVSQSAASWTGDTSTSHDGAESLRSGYISDNDESWIETTISGSGRISFWWKASSEEYDGEVFDYAYLSVDGVPQGSLENYQLQGVAIGGKTDWTNIVFDVEGEGVHTIRWTYCKDEVDEAAVGDDCIWLDEFSFLPKPTISFDIGTSSIGNAPSPIQDFVGADIALPNAEGFYWTDHVFDGWTDGVNSFSAGSDYIIPSSNVTLVARWIAKTFVSFDIDGGGGVPPELIKALPSTIVTLPTGDGFSWIDHVFDGWTDGVKNYAGGADYTVPSTNVTLTAKWIAKSFVSFDIGEGVGNVPETIKEVPNAIVTLPTADNVEWVDHVFSGWCDGVNVYAGGVDYVVPSSNVTLTAYWRAKSFVSFDIGDGTGDVPETMKALPNETVSLPTGDGLSLTDYVFNGWTDGLSDYAAGADYAVPETNVTLKAIWIAKRFLTFTLDGGDGEIPITIKDVPNATVTLPSGEGFHKAKHTFVGWSDGMQTYDAGAEYVVTDSSVEFTAVWAANRLVAPTISSADVANGGTIEISNATIEITADSGTAIYYTLDGTEPTTNSMPYVAPFVADGMEVTIKAFAVKDDYFDSPVSEFAFSRKPYSAAECINAYRRAVSTGNDDAAWVRVLGDAAHDGVAALRSGVIDEGGTSSVEMSVDGAGEIGFWWKASCERVIRGQPKDHVAFYVDGVSQCWMGGLTDWSNVVVSVSGEGAHVLKWVYQKDTNEKVENEDCAWLDEVVWTPMDPIPAIASDSELAAALAGTADNSLTANVTNAVQYAAYRAWALSVTNATTTAQTIKESTRTWLSYAFAANALIDKELTSDDVKIESFTPASTDGKFEFTVSVKDVNIGGGSVAVETLKENLKKVLAVEGAATLSPGGFSSDNIDITFDAPIDGKAKFTVSPPADAGNSFFMRVKVK